MSGETPLDESLNPIWVLLSKGEKPNLWLPPSESWERSLRARSQELEEGRELIVPVPRPLARSALALLSGGGRQVRRGPTPRTMRRLLDALGLEVAATYGLWPSPRSPRVAFPWRRLHMLFWLQTSGVLGGGGNRLWARVLARSVLFTPIAVMLSPGVAFVVRRPIGVGG